MIPSTIVVLPISLTKAITACQIQLTFLKMILGDLLFCTITQPRKGHYQIAVDEPHSALWRSKGFVDKEQEKNDT